MVLVIQYHPLCEYGSAPRNIVSVVTVTRIVHRLSYHVLIVYLAIYLLRVLPSSHTARHIEEIFYHTTITSSFTALPPNCGQVRGKTKT